MICTQADVGGCPPDVEVGAGGEAALDNDF